MEHSSNTRPNTVKMSCVNLTINFDKSQCVTLCFGLFVSQLGESTILSFALTSVMKNEVKENTYKKTEQLLIVNGFRNRRC